MSGLRQAASKAARRNDALLAGQGIYAETLSRSTSLGSSLTISGTVYFMAVGLVAGDVVTNIAVGCNAVVTGGTLTKVGLYTKAQSLVAASVDATASFASTGLKTIAMATPYTVPVDDLYYVAFIGVHAGTAVTLTRSTTSLLAGIHNALPGGVGMMGVQNGQTDLPASATISFGSSPIWFWAAIS